MRGKRANRITFPNLFLSLVIIRLLEKKLDNKYSISNIIVVLKIYNSTNIEHDLYLQNYK